MTVTTATATTTAVRRAGRHRRTRTRSRVARLVTGLLLAVTAITAVTGTTLVVVRHYGLAPVLSPSMRPTYEPGALLVTRPLPTSQVAVGQALVLPLPDAPGERYVHRVIEVDRTGGQTIVRTKGDNNPAPDPKRLRITSSTVPVVVTSVPSLGRFTLITRGGLLRSALIGFVALCLLVAVKRALLSR